MHLICDIVVLVEENLCSITLIWLFSLKDGLDFYYSSKQHAQKMVEFLQCTVPARYVLKPTCD